MTNDSTGKQRSPLVYVLIGAAIAGVAAYGFYTYQQRQQQAMTPAEEIRSIVEEAAEQVGEVVDEAVQENTQ